MSFRPLNLGTVLEQMLYTAILFKSDNEIRTKLQSGWQKQGHTWHIVPRNHSSKVGLIDLIIGKIREIEEKNRRKTEKSKGLIGF